MHGAGIFCRKSAYKLICLDTERLLGSKLSHNVFFTCLKIIKILEISIEIFIPYKLSSVHTQNTWTALRPAFIYNIVFKASSKPFIYLMKKSLICEALSVREVYIKLVKVVGAQC